MQPLPNQGSGVHLAGGSRRSLRRLGELLLGLAALGSSSAALGGPTGSAPGASSADTPPVGTAPAEIADAPPVGTEPAEVADAPPVGMAPAAGRAPSSAPPAGQSSRAGAATPGPAGDRGAGADGDEADGDDGAEPEEAPLIDDYEDWVFENPFAEVYDEGPGLLRLALQVGSYHRDGIGPAVTLVPWEYLQLTASYGYRTDHSVAGLLTVPVLPRALLTPYATAGYALAIASLPQGIRLDSHQFVAGLGLEARIADRYVLGAEMTGNGVVHQTLKTKSTTVTLSPGERFTVQAGFHIGVHLP